MAPMPLSDIVFSDLDKEPNNTLLQASNISFTSDELELTASLELGDVDSYKIKAKAGSIVDITITPLGAGDIVVDISNTNQDKGRIYYDNFGDALSETLSNIRLSPQGVYLTVRARAQEKLAYKMQIHRIVSDSVLEEEPNNDLELAQTIILPSKVQGSVNPQADEDYYLLSVTKAAVLNIEAPGIPMEWVLTGDKGEVWRTTSNEAVVLSSDILPPLPKPYVLRVTALDGFETISAYALNLQEASAMNTEREPNDSLQSAQTLAPSTDAVSLSFLSAGDVDYFKLLLPEDEGEAVFNARVQVQQGASATLELFDEAFHPLPVSSSESSNICALGLKNMGSVIAKISHKGAANLPYPLAYSLAWSSSPALGREQEPNDLPQDANILAFGVPVKGNIFGAADIDVYKIEVPAVAGRSDAVGQLQIQSAAGYIAGLRFKLQDAQLFEISQAQSQVFSAPLRMSFDAPSGTYYLMVSGSGDECVKSYEITATFVPNTENTAPGASNPEQAALGVLDNLPPNEPQPPTNNAPEGKVVAPQPAQPLRVIETKPAVPPGVDPDAF